MRKHGITLLLIVLSFVASLASLPHLPEKVATHWNLHGEVDGYSSKWVAAFLIPGLMALIYLLFTLIPRIDPRKENYEKFASSYRWMITIFIVFFFILHLVLMANGLGYPIDVSWVVPVMVGIMFILFGNVMPRIRHNYFVGIRTPWTLASESNWIKTHRFGGRMFVLAGLFMVLGSFLPAPAKGFATILLPMLLVLTTVGYSFFQFRKEQS